MSRDPAAQAAADEFARTFDWPTVPADLWRAYTLQGPWDMPIVAPHARDPIAFWSYPVPDNPATLYPAKLCENRVRGLTHWRGPLLIHAGKRWDPAGESDPNVRAMWRSLCPGLVLRQSVWTWAGHVTGVARLVDCHLATPGCCPPWGQYEYDRDENRIYHQTLADVRALTEPVAEDGRQGLWKPTQTLVEKVRPVIPRKVPQP